MVEALAGYVGTTLWPCPTEDAKTIQTLEDPTWFPLEKPSKLD